MDFFLRSKEETFLVFEVFGRQVQVKYNENITGIKSDQGTEFENIRFSHFCYNLNISHNFLAPRTPQGNGILERINRTLEDIGRTILIDARIAHSF